MFLLMDGVNIKRACPKQSVNWPRFELAGNLAR